MLGFEPCLYAPLEEYLNDPNNISPETFPTRTNDTSSGSSIDEYLNASSKQQIVRASSIINSTAQINSPNPQNVCFQFNKPCGELQVEINNHDHALASDIGNSNRKRKASGMSAPNQNKKKNKDKITENENTLKELKRCCEIEKNKIGRLDLLLYRAKHSGSSDYDFQNLSIQTTSCGRYDLIKDKEKKIEAMEEDMETFRKNFKDKYTDYITQQDKLKKEIKLYLDMLQNFAQDVQKKTDSLLVV